MIQDSLFDLSGKAAVVTGAGANGGIGHAIAIGLSRYGAAVVAADIDAPGAEATAAEIEAASGRSVAVNCDIAQPDQVDQLFALAAVTQLPCGELIPRDVIAPDALQCRRHLALTVVQHTSSCRSPDVGARHPVRKPEVRTPPSRAAT